MMEIVKDQEMADKVKTLGVLGPCDCVHVNPEHVEACPGGFYVATECEDEAVSGALGVEKKIRAALKRDPEYKRELANEFRKAFEALPRWLPEERQIEHEI